jgi:ABC-type multidrug transport system fused ATPase/permease subunit
MEERAQLTQATQAKLKDCRVMSQAYATTLSALVPANFLLVVGAALLSLVAGATILIKGNLLSETTAGILALMSGALTIIHSKLGCEQYQSECKKLSSFYRGIAEDYGNLQFITDENEFRRRVSALNDQLSSVVKNSSAVPFDWTLTKAKQRPE